MKKAFDTLRTFWEVLLSGIFSVAIGTAVLGSIADPILTNLFHLECNSWLPHVVSFAVSAAFVYVRRIVWAISHEGRRDHRTVIAVSKSIA
ncbi:hypothetical protein OH799_23475 [Nocardia sp. NBC_00881]|uniref:hypothetical protein n=1 Tax=Nocardia sp. NBC_00881 TaxID=2975995 RepID=UPI003867A281|nr:hypothetical protein OH799_23475 [Nocardia sp. NBC_00881]